MRNNDHISYRTILFLIGFFVLSLIILYINIPSVLAYIYPNEGLELESVVCPEQIFRTEELTIHVGVKNVGSFKKSVLVKVFSKDGPTQSNWTTIPSESPVNSVALKIPVTSIGLQAFSIKIYWMGPLGISNLKQDEYDVLSNILAAEYTTSSIPNYASISENFNLELSIENSGNIAAEKLVVSVIDKGSMSIFQPDAVTIENFDVGESRTASFRFTVPYNTKEGKETVSIEFETHYLYGIESTINEYDVTLQKSPSHVQLENTKQQLTRIVGILSLLVVIIAIIQGKRFR